MHRTILCLLVFCLSVLAELQAGRPLTFQDFIALDAISDPRLSPDGQSLAFVVTDYSLEKNRGNSDIWILDVKSRKVRRLTETPGTDNQPGWSSDGKELAFVSDRSGSQQIHVLTLASGETRKVTDVKQGIANLTWSPDGKYFAFSSDVSWPPNQARTEPGLETRALVWDDLFYRHWSEWRVGQRSHVFVMPAAGGAVRDLTPIDNDVPTLALGGYQDIAFTPDGSELLYVMNPDGMRAASTNNDIFAVPVAGGPPRNLTAANKSNDNNPSISPDGRWMAYRAQLRPGFEADRHHLMLMDRSTGHARDLTADWSLSVGEILWAPDNKAIYAEVEEQGRDAIYRITVADGKREKVVKDGHNASPRISPDGQVIFTLRESAVRPDEIYSNELTSGKSERLTDVNGPALAGIDMNPAEEFWFPGAMNHKVHGFLVKPPAFDPSRKYPLVYLIHGGPQGAMQDNFHARWNYQMFAAPDYVVAMVNFHGSTGYGQEFTDSISQHWGDYPYEDLMKGVDHLLATYPFIDGKRISAAGASYGGYMIFWMGTHTDRFNCLVAHDGVYNLESMWGSTEELWFPEWEFGGTPWQNREVYRKWSPSNFSQNFKTPMLVVHGQQDFRVDVSQGFEAYSALRRQNIPARFLYFPDEGHWVLKPRNRRVWWNEVLAWLEKYLK